MSTEMIIDQMNKARNVLPPGLVDAILKLRTEIARCRQEGDDVGEGNSKIQLALIIQDNSHLENYIQAILRGPC